MVTESCNSVKRDGLAVEIDPLHSAKGGVLEKAALMFEDDIWTVCCCRDGERDARRDMMHFLLTKRAEVRVNFNLMNYF